MFIPKFDSKFVIFHSRFIAKLLQWLKIIKCLYLSFGLQWVRHSSFPALIPPLTSTSLFQAAFHPSGFMRDVWNRGERVRHAFLTLLLSSPSPLSVPPFDCFSTHHQLHSPKRAPRGRKTVSGRAAKKTPTHQDVCQVVSIRLITMKEAPELSPSCQHVNSHNGSWKKIPLTCLGWFFFYILLNCLLAAGDWKTPAAVAESRRPFTAQSRSVCKFPHLDCL